MVLKPTNAYKRLRKHYILYHIHSMHVIQYTFQHLYAFIGFMTRGNGFGGLGVACWPLVPKFAGSNPAKKFSARLPSEGK